MATRPINVLVYAGKGISTPSLHQALSTLRTLLSPHYAVSPVSTSALLTEPWQSTCALLVFPGGADLAYCAALDGAGNRRIKAYVRAGGAYLGFCAGGYYGTARCEFEVGGGQMEVVGPRELAFFPGTSRGAAFTGFKYNSEAGTRAAEMKVNKAAFAAAGVLPDSFRTYFNGGSVFVDAGATPGVEVLGEYTEPLHVDPGEGAAAAVVYCAVGEGRAVLTGPHPEFAGAGLRKDLEGIDPKVVDVLREHDRARGVFMRACLTKLGLAVNQEESEVPGLSAIHFSSAREGAVEKTVDAWGESTTIHGADTYIKGDQDTFQLQRADSAWSLAGLTRAALEILTGNNDAAAKPQPEPLADLDQVIKTIVAHEASAPLVKDTPYFNHEAYYNALSAYHASQKPAPPRLCIGDTLMYGQVVTSTSTLLEKNNALTKHLPNGATLTATTQLSGRGRGSNAWISPAGSLMFSFVIRHPLTLNVTAPVVFIQYLAAMAVAEAVRAYNPSASSDAPTPPKADSLYSRMPVALKWPNDVYILDPAHPGFADAVRDSSPEKTRPACVKIGGILVNSSYAGGDYTLIVGIGLNVSNAAPTTSLNAVLEALAAQRKATAAAAAPYALENLLPAILTKFSALYDTFCAQGFAGDLERLYYKYWLHDQQLVTLETEGGVRARVKGITTDWGLLRAEEVDERGVGRGREFAMQTDSNSFDFFKGLVKRKL